MTVKTSATTTLFVSAATPATFDAAGYNALSWTEVGEVTDLGEFGREYGLVTHIPLKSRATQKYKGSFNEGAMAIQLGKDTDDAGQVIMKTASESDADYSFRVTTQNGDKFFMQAKVMTWKTIVGNADQITGASANLELTTSSGGVGVVADLA